MRPSRLSGFWTHFLPVEPSACRWVFLSDPSTVLSWGSLASCEFSEFLSPLNDDVFILRIISLGREFSGDCSWHFAGSSCCLRPLPCFWRGIAALSRVLVCDESLFPFALKTVSALCSLWLWRTFRIGQV